MNLKTGYALGRSTSLLRTVAVVSFVGAVSGVAGPTQAQNFAFNDVAINGNQRVADGTILTFAGIARGEQVTAGSVNDASQRIRESGLFSEVNVRTQGNTLVIDVVEFPTVNRVNIEGNSQVRDAQLLSVVRSEPRRVYTPTQAEADTAAITEVYASLGRINAVVTPRIIPLSDNRVDLVFEVVESGLTEVERIAFVGNRNFSESRLRRVLETKQAGILRQVITRDTFAADRVAVDRRVLTDFYQSRGYADFQVQNVDVALTRERDAYLMTFNVQEGQQFKFGNISVSSAIPEADAEVFRAALKTRPGAVYTPVSLESDISRLELLATRMGINFLQVEPRITRDDRNLQLNVEFALVRGERIFVERIDIEGNSTTLDRVIRNQFRVVEGDPFNPREVRESAERIRALGFFQNAAVNAREGSGPNQVIVDVDVEEGPTGSLSFGANYNTDVGLGLLASYGQDNFLGRGQSLDVQVSTAETNRVLSLSFSEPNFLGRDLRAGFAMNYGTTDNENANFDTESFTLRPSLNFPVSDNGRLSTYYSFNYEDLTDVSTTVSEIIQEEAERGAVSTNSVGYTYSFDSRRAGIDPVTSYVFRFGQEFGVGDSNFVKTTALAAVETQVLSEEVTLRATIEGGSLDYADNDSRVTDRYFLGSRLMRGFDAGGIGPRDADTGDALGGNKYAVARLEAEFPLGLPEEYGVSGGLFLDHGSVWDVGNTYSADVLYNDFTARTVVGATIFWTTPIGPLRFNFTEALDAQDEDETKSFDVTISTSF
ncbi:outer membrane protein assembly factor BamA [Yoonia ponticola]|uniref:outer membrane protein assembly factor BamA n=1 Tax=Yoonia ponticola TaxID=1524255 RepID=UPI00160A79BA|nr:outer membrane protein assembly factor BamA [Yoonia ponticola]